HGIRNMPSYGSQIDPGDRWAIVAYVRALQRSQNATVDDVPPDKRAGLR
nr:cytochrome c [Acidobacteriota bacterium]